MRQRVAHILITAGDPGDQIEELIVDLVPRQMLTVSVDGELTLTVTMRDRTEVEIPSATGFLALLYEVLARIEDNLVTQFGELGHDMLDAPVAPMRGGTFRGIVSAGFGCRCKGGIPDVMDLDSMTCPVHRAPRLIEVDDTNE